MLNIVLITHEGIGSSMLDVATAIVGNDLKHTTCFEVAMDADTSEIIDQVIANIESTQLDTLILTDLVGSTPYNVASSVAERSDATLVSGLNLPMLLRVLNYRAYRLNEVSEMAVEGGRLAIQAK